MDMVGECSLKYSGCLGQGEYTQDPLDWNDFDEEVEPDEDGWRYPRYEERFDYFCENCLKERAYEI